MRNFLPDSLAVSAVFGAALAACASGPTPPADVPQSLHVPDTLTLAVALHASGVQIYECQPGKADATQFQWTFRAPEAELTDDGGKPVGKHYAGPTWEDRDGSKVVAAVEASAPSPDPDAIAWLLLGVKSTSGDGVFANVKAIQRLQTAGGKAPKDGCTRELAGRTARVPYTGIYYFYR
jgi:hypothetical protein